MKHTPENIAQLKPHQVFVFGSNLAGDHAGGAAKIALERFGAIYGLGEGWANQSYAFPTLDEHMQKVSKKSLVDSKTLLYFCAARNPDKKFLVTKIGCGIAGFTIDEMKEVFKGEKPDNVILPKEFV